LQFEGRDIEMARVIPPEGFETPLFAG